MVCSLETQRFANSLWCVRKIILPILGIFDPAGHFILGRAHVQLGEQNLQRVQLGENSWRVVDRYDRTLSSSESTLWRRASERKLLSPADFVHPGVGKRSSRDKGESAVHGADFVERQGERSVSFEDDKRSSYPRTFLDRERMFPRSTSSHHGETNTSSSHFVTADEGSDDEFDTVRSKYIPITSKLYQESMDLA